MELVGSGILAFRNRRARVVIRIIGAARRGMHDTRPDSLETTFCRSLLDEPKTLYAARLTAPLTVSPLRVENS